MSKAGAKKKGGKGKDTGGSDDALQDEKEKEDLARFTKVLLELEEAKLKTERLERNNDENKKTIEELRSELDTVRRDANDVMAQMKREITEKTTLVEQLMEKVTTLEESVLQYCAAIASLEKDRSEAKTQLDSAVTAMEDKARMEDTIRTLNESLQVKNNKIETYKSTIANLQQQVQTSTQHLDDLRLELARSTSTAHVAGCEWTLKRSKQRLTGDLGLDVPSERDRCSLTAVGRMLVMFGGTTRDGGCTNDVFAFNSDTMQWERNRPAGDAPAPRGGHVAVLLSKKRVFVFAGRRNPLLNDAFVLNTEKMMWTALRTRGAVPAPVEKASATFVDNQVLVMGGDCTPTHSQTSAEINVSRNTYLLDLESKIWALAEVTGPVPFRCGASLTLSHNSRFVFAFGGYDSEGTHHNDVHVLSLERWEWSKPEMVMGTPPAPREGHTATMIGRYLLISGGGNGSTRFLDTFVFDTEQLCWECLDSGTGAESMPSVGVGTGGAHARVPGLSSIVGAVDILSSSTAAESGRDDGDKGFNAAQRWRTCVFLGSRLLCLSAAGASSFQLVMLDILDISIPEEAFQSSHIRSDQVAVEARQVANEFRMIEISWRPPPRHKARITAYKVMMSVGRSSTVREIYAGKEDRCRVIGVRPGVEYLFRVKGEYSDGGCAWSDITTVIMKQPDGAIAASPPSSPSRVPKSSGGKSTSPQRSTTFFPSLLLASPNGKGSSSISEFPTRSAPSSPSPDANEAAVSPTVLKKLKGVFGTKSVSLMQ